MLSLFLLVSGLGLVLLHSLLVADWLAEGDASSLYAAVALLALGLALVWASRRLNTSILRRRGLEVKYGGAYLGCAWSGLSLLDVVAMYALVYAVTVAVALAEGELGELLGAMHFIMTAVMCVVYPLFYHPHGSLLAEVADILDGLRRVAGAISFSYARGIGLMAKLGEGEYAVLSLPPFEEAAPFVPLEALDAALVGRGEALLYSPIVAVKLLGDAESYVSLSSLVGWPLKPRFRAEGGWRSVDLGDGSVCHVARGLVDMPHPESGSRRLRGRAVVAEVHLSRKRIKRAERRPGYALSLASRILPRVLAELRAAASGG